MALIALLAGLTGLAVPADAATGAAQQLAAKYAPIVMVRTQTDGICDSDEQYWPPTTVDVMLGNPRVRLLLHTARRTRVITRGPTVADIAGLGPGFYLDLPGNPLQPGCTFARNFNALRKAGRGPAVTYAHLARERGHSGFALQFWFFYYFNDFNDLHEGDWEGMQLAFHAETPAAALSEQPYEIVLFQHAGGEHARWKAGKVKRDGTHPVVYSAAGSHATFYGSALYLGNGGNGSGVGCDDTTAPVTATHPRAILLPATPERTGPFAWLSYTGRWGQLEAGFNNGPAGPNTKTVWRKPFTWMDGTRDSSPTVPGGALAGPSVAGAFCGAVAGVSEFLNLAAQTSDGALGIALACVLLVLVPVCLTRWRPVSLDSLHEPRATGQLLLTAGRFYGRHAWPLLAIAALSLLLSAALEGFEWLVLHAFGTSDAGTSFTNSNGASGLSLSLGLAQFIGGPLGSSAVVAFVRDLDRGRPAGVLSSWKAALRRAVRIVLLQLYVTLLVSLMAITVIGIPFAIRKYVDWQFGQQEIIFEDRKIREALRASRRLVRGHWWHTGAVAGTFWVLSQITGPFLGFALLFTSVPVVSVNLFGSVIATLLLPYVAAGRTLLYFDLAARQAAEPVPAALGLAPAGAG